MFSHQGTATDFPPNEKNEKDMHWIVNRNPSTVRLHKAFTMEGKNTSAG